MIYLTHDAKGGEIRYADARRWLWILSTVMPSLPFWSAMLVVWTGQAAWAALTVAVGFGLVPVLDWLCGEDAHNPPEEVAGELGADPWYRWLLYAALGVFYASFLAAAVVAGSGDLPVWAFVLLAVGAGVASGTALVVGHELGHKPGRPARIGAVLANALTGYAHFTIEHNRGHHAMVATPEDTASARLGESFYRFMLREIPGAAARAWGLERKRLARKDLPFWHWANQLLPGYALSLAIAVTLIGAFGWIMIPFLAIHHAFGWLQLTAANYIEHYGLLREKKADGRYAPCEPRHSWNTNHIMSNLMLFHLQRHSDHHANPLRPYQVLRDFSGLPRLPSGYPGCYLMAAAPPLWFAVMDRKVLAWAGGDLSRTNHVAGYRAGA